MYNLYKLRLKLELFRILEREAVEGKREKGVTLLEVNDVGIQKTIRFETSKKKKKKKNREFQTQRKKTQGNALPSTPCQRNAVYQRFRVF